MAKENSGSNAVKTSVLALAIITSLGTTLATTSHAKARPSSIDTVNRAAPKYPSDVVPLSRANGFFRNNDAPDFWALMPYHTGQTTNSACSLATATILLNGMRRNVPLGQGDPLLTGESILDRTADKAWKKATDEDGGGVSLEQFASILRKAFKAHGFAAAGADAVYQSSNFASGELEFERDLIKDAGSARDFIILNFDQGYVMDDVSVGHFAIVGAYDKATRRILILDPDRDWYEPYWAPIGKVYRSMAETRGYIRVTY